MKRILMAMCLAAALLVIDSSSNPALAQDVWVISQHGGDYYVVTETYCPTGDEAFSVNVKIVVPNAKRFNLINCMYEYKRVNGVWKYRADFDNYLRVDKGDAAANAILRYCMANLFD